MTESDWTTFTRSAASIAAHITGCEAPRLFSAASFRAIAPRSDISLTDISLLVCIQDPDPMPGTGAQVDRFAAELHGRGIREMARCSGVPAAGSDVASAILFHTAKTFELDYCLMEMRVQINRTPQQSAESQGFGARPITAPPVAEFGSAPRSRASALLDNPGAHVAFAPVPAGPFVIGAIDEINGGGAVRQTIPVSRFEAQFLWRYWLDQIADCEEMYVIYRQSSSNGSRQSAYGAARVTELINAGLVERGECETHMRDARRRRGMRPRSW